MFPGISGSFENVSEQRRVHTRTDKKVSTLGLTLSFYFESLFSFRQFPDNGIHIEQGKKDQKKAQEGDCLLCVNPKTEESSGGLDPIHEKAGEEGG